jgi:hypothetical protein
MAESFYTVGIHNVGSYQVSGKPWITGSDGMRGEQEEKVEFPYITKSITVVATKIPTGGQMRVHFNATSSAVLSTGGDILVLTEMHYFPLCATSASFTFNSKCKEIYVSTTQAGGDNANTYDYRVVAELTHIPVERMYNLTGSGLTERSG